MAKLSGTLRAHKTQPSWLHFSQTNTLGIGCTSDIPWQRVCIQTPHTSQAAIRSPSSSRVPHLQATTQFSMPPAGSTCMAQPGLHAPVTARGTQVQPWFTSGRRCRCWPGHGSSRGTHWHRPIWVTVVHMGPPACRHSGCRSTLWPLACTTVPCGVSEVRQPSSEKVMPDSSTTCSRQRCTSNNCYCGSACMWHA